MNTYRKRVSFHAVKYKYWFPGGFTYHNSDYKTQLIKVQRLTTVISSQALYFLEIRLVIISKNYLVFDGLFVSRGA